MNEPKIIQINDVPYIRKDSVSTVDEDGLERVVIRSSDSGVHVGLLDHKDGNEVRLLKSRRIWRWKGAATLSELSQKGISKTGSKVPAAVPMITVIGVCEIIPMTEKAWKSIQEVPEWTA